MSRVVVTGAGGPAGVAVVRALGVSGHHVVAIDSDPLSAGLHLAADCAVVAGADQPDRFLSDLDALIDKFDVDVVVSTVAEEMLVLDGHQSQLGAALWIPDHQVVATCLDKWRFARAFATTATSPAGVVVADTALVREELAGQDTEPVEGRSVDEIARSLPGPWIVKPRFGRGSRDVHAVDDVTELAWACRRVPQPIVQRRVGGREFTVDVLTDRDGRVAGAVPRWRIETKAGISTKGETFRDSAVLDATRATIEALGLDGVANVQGFVTEEDDVVIIEVNPRFSGGLPLSLAAGADLVGEYVRGATGQPVRPDRLGFRPGRHDDAPLHGGVHGMRILIPFGTRPEVVKVASVIAALRSAGHEVRAVSTGQQHDPRLADDFFNDLDVEPDARWNLPTDEAERVGALLTGAYRELADHPADVVMVLGDTHTVPLFALAARRAGVPVVHLEAGLRSFNERSLEEVHRRSVVAMASLHFAPDIAVSHHARVRGRRPPADLGGRQPRSRRAGPPRTGTPTALGAARRRGDRAPGHQRRRSRTSRRARAVRDRAGGPRRTRLVPGAPPHRTRGSGRRGCATDWPAIPE